MCYFIQLLILVLNLEQRLTVLDGGLHHYRTCPENITVHHDVVVEDLGKDPPVLQPPIKRLVTRPHRSTTDVNDCVTADDGASKEWWVAVLWQRGGTLFTFILLHLIYGTVQRLGAWSHLHYWPLQPHIWIEWGILILDAIVGHEDIAYALGVDTHKEKMLLKHVVEEQGGKLPAEQ